MGENEIPFPLLSGQWVSVYKNGIEQYVRIMAQPRFFDLEYAYEIGPDLDITDQTINIGTGSGAVNVFRTSGLKQWVTWIDNKYLSVAWTINSLDINSLNSFSYPQDSVLTPYGSVNFPLFVYDDPAGNVSFTLTNTSLTKTIRGTLHILLYEYKVSKPLSSDKPAPIQYTSTFYQRGEQ